MGLILVKPKVFHDRRGFFVKLLEFKERGIPSIVQTNMSFWGGPALPAPSPKEQGKIVFVPKGERVDVAVDTRKPSPTFGKHVKVELSNENHYMLWIPLGFAQGF